MFSDINLKEGVLYKKGKRKVLPRPQEKEKTDKSKQAQTEQMYEKH